ncbi:MAG: 1-(5-phosphoribosyl)-5-[(5-phosphoribosylamino)methylideneamino] imidazole-4-carboxamide isomerase [Firmicutes bacterium]|nr:1-(5-phosphoribosyl)-5-[(5-phosphoribosylamino)methylideneamino] imidazole-4-carboxamide isomerase [Bacillota bacterium]
MLIVPALDLLGGRVVRLEQGDFGRRLLDLDPLEAARRWVAEGARRLHVVDLDGARQGRPAQLELVARIAALGVPVELGGGLRGLEDVAAAFAAGAWRAVLGTAAVRHPELLAAALERWGPGRVTAQLDLRAGRPATAGWREEEPLDPRRLLRRWQEAGLREVLLSDASRDGTLAGFDPAPYLAVLPPDLAWWAAGGLAGPRDLERAAPLEERGLRGLIVGRALYEGRIRLGGERT